ncbi:MAG: HD domain-containing protein [Nanoarchaeota archaeon]|nr:HD domain-containing protein [Nanoarchaeota archaeon]
MNSIDKKPDYRKIYQIVKKLFDKTKHFKHGPFDETYYTLRVFESAKDIIKKLKKNVNKEEVLVAAILHDVGKIKLKQELIFGKDGILDNAKAEWFKHAKLGVPIAKDILRKLCHSDEFITKVCYLIENHDKRKKLKEKSLELQILQDADLLSDCGLAGFIRPFLYCGKFSHASIISSIHHIQEEENRAEDDNLMNLKVSKKLAHKKLKFQKRLIKEISKDIDSELL